MLTNDSFKNKHIFFISLSFLLTVSIVFSLLFGSTFLNVENLFTNNDSGFTRLLFTQIRLPRTLLALLTGSLLSMSGCVFQMYFRNPLAEPGVMGISSGATLGAVIASCIFVPVSFGAFFGALIAGLLVTFATSGRTKFSSTVALLLCGTALGTFYSALTSILLSANSSRLQSMYIWMMGSFSGRSWDDFIFILIPSALSFLFMFLCNGQLDLLSGGEVCAKSLGVNVKALRLKVILCGSFASCAACCAGGTIGFVGLIAPHIVRQFASSRQKYILPLSMLTGSIITVLADLLSRLVIRPAELPVGTITALVGAPFFISILFAGRKNK